MKFLLSNKLTKLFQELLLLFNNCERLVQTNTHSDSSTAWKAVGFRLSRSRLKFSNSVSREIVNVFNNTSVS